MRPLRALAAALAVALGLAGCGDRPAPPPVEGRSTEAFADSVGVVVHFNYTDTAYARRPELVGRLRELGVRHVRDGVPVRAPALARGLRAAADAGIRPTILHTGTEIPAREGVAASVELLGRDVAAFEGPNELDNRFPDWERRLDAYLPSLRRAVDELAPGTPLLGPSFVDPAAHGEAVDGSTYDLLNSHPYPGALPPEAPVRDELRRRGVLAEAERVVFTETGYHNAIEATTGQPPASEAAAATYLPRLLLTAFAAGVRRTFVYELVDEKPEPGRADPEQHFGLLRNDLSPKPAFRAVRDLLAAMRDGPAGPRGERPPSPRVRAGENVERLELVRPDGSRVLVLWRPVSVWDRDARRPLDPGSSAVDVTWPAPVARVEVVRPALGARPVATRSATRGVRIDLGGDVVLVSFR